MRPYCHIVLVVLWLCACAPPNSDNAVLYDKLLYASKQAFDSGVFIGRYERRSKGEQKSHTYGSVKLLLVGNDYLRKECVVDGSTEITAINKATAKEYFQGAGLGLIRNGSAKDVGVVASHRGLLEVLRAGRPGGVGYVFEAEHIISTEQVSTPEGRAIRVAMQRFTILPDNLGTLQVMWVLPERDYCVYKSQLYRDGNLLSETVFGKYVKTADGYWYPLSQKMTSATATLNERIKSKYVSKQIPIDPDEIMNNQQIAGTYLTSYEFEKLSLNDDLDLSLFDTEFPEGTRVNDYIMTGENAMPLEYTVGPGLSLDELLAQTDDLKLDEIVAPGDSESLPRISGPNNTHPRAVDARPAAPNLPGTCQQSVKGKKVNLLIGAPLALFVIGAAVVCIVLFAGKNR